jgi:Tfp pilus assembly protein PilV
VILLHKQYGSTLIVALVMLILLTLIAISAMNATTSSIQVVGNAQFREEANTAAQQAIEGVISSNFTTAPVAATVPVTVGAASYTVQVAVPTCTSSIAITNADLDVTKAADLPCIASGAASNTGIMSASGGGAVPTAQSWCYKQRWDIGATVNDANTGTNAEVHQGVYLRVVAGTACP